MERLKTLERPGLNVIHKKIISNEDRTCRGEIKGLAESQFFNLAKPICDKKGWEIQYEPKTFTVIFKDNVKMSTSPDFLITRPGQKDICIELESGYYDPNRPFAKDPKRRQKNIMSKFPDIIYVVLYKQDLDKLEKKHPSFSFKPPRR